MARFDLSREAREDLFQIRNYGVDNWGQDAADANYINLHRHFEKLAEQPLQYLAIDHVSKGYRRSVCENETVY